MPTHQDTAETAGLEVVGAHVHPLGIKAVEAALAAAVVPAERHYLPAVMAALAAAARVVLPAVLAAAQQY